MESNYHDTDIVVIGGGLAGLAVASYLGRAGRRVTLFEKSSKLGGRAITQERHGYYFNLGAHALYEQSPAVEVLRELGVRYTTGTPVGVRCMSGGQSYLAPADPLSLLQTKLIGKRAKWEMSRLMLKLQLIDPQTLAGVSVREWLDREVSHSDARRLLEASARVLTYTNSPERLSMGLFIEQLRQTTKGKVLYVDGGWQTLVDRLARVARDAGVTIVSDARVEAVEYQAGRATGVRLAGGDIYGAQAVVIAAGPRETSHLVAAGENPTLRGWAENAVPVKAACLDVALRRLPQPENKVVFSIDSPLFLTVQSEFSRVAPAGGALLYALKYLDPFAPSDDAEVKKELEEWLDLAQPGWRDEVVECRYMPHLTVSNALVQADQGGTVGRPGPVAPGIEDLYVVGDWVGPRGMLSSASLWSARLAANSILARLGSVQIKQAA